MAWFLSVCQTAGEGRKHRPSPGLSERTCSDCSPTAARRSHTRHQEQRPLLWFQMGDTCLHVAARYNNLTLVKILLSSLCSLIERNQGGDTALHVAAALNHKKTVQLLLEAGTDGKTRNNQAGKTALDKARDNNHKDVALLLARAPQVHRFMRGRTIRKRRERLTAERRTQSFTRAPANGCHCKPLIKKLEGQVKATQEEMRLHILTVQEQVNSRMGKMAQRNRHQIKVLNRLNQEKAAAEKKNMVYRIEQRVAQDKEEALKTQQAAVSQELKRWCASHLKDMDVHAPVEAQYYKLLPSPSVEQSAADPDLESLPLLSVVSGESSTSLANYVNILPSRAAYCLDSLEPERAGRRTYFEMRVDRSPDYENTALFPLPANHTSGLPLGSADPLSQPPGVQDGPTAAVVPLCGESFSSSSSSSQASISDQGPRLITHQGHSYDRQHRKHLVKLMSAHRHAEIHGDRTRTLEFFIDRPTEPTFNQERKNLHAMEV
uniref:Ankyrin repeat domain-containing protein 6-like n=1 Tax=Seriola dumerili TaxID=41447 RepID=A0A3B4VGB3_SERDU